jgi:hypothetical protein
MRPVVMIDRRVTLKALWATSRPEPNYHACPLHPQERTNGQTVR